MGACLEFRFTGDSLVLECTSVLSQKSGSVVVSLILGPTRSLDSRVFT